MDTDVIIVGGGLNGPALALALAAGGLRSVIVDSLPTESRKDAAFDGRAYALSLASQRLFTALGLWQAVAAEAQPILEIKVSDGRAGEGPAPFFVHFHHGEIEEGPMGHVVEDRFLRRALLDAVEAAPEITHLSAATAIAQDTSGTEARVTLEGGQTIRGRLVVAADGRQSATAARAGIRRTGWGYGQSALVAAIRHERPHGGIAHQFFMPPGPLAILPLPGNRSSIVWTETRAEAARVHGLPPEAYLDHLRPRFGDFLGDIALEGGRFTYPLGLSLAERFVAPRVALVGDAAHGIHPIAGQGLNLGLRDVAALAECLVDARRRGEDIGAPGPLREYERWRRFDTAVMAAATDGVNRLFSNDNPLLRLGRDLGLGVVNALPGLKRRFIREAAGLTGELPRLMQGRPI